MDDMSGEGSIIWRSGIPYSMGEREAYAWYDTLNRQAIHQETDLEGASSWRVFWVYIEEVQVSA